MGRVPRLLAGTPLPRRRLRVKIGTANTARPNATRITSQIANWLRFACAQVGTDSAKMRGRGGLNVTVTGNARAKGNVRATMRTWA